MAFVLIGFCMLWIGLGLGGHDAVLWVDDGATAGAALAAAAACAYAARRDPGPLRRFWSLLAAACGCWASAEVTWAIYDLALRTPVPVPSWADLGYLTAIPLAIAALLAHPGMHDAPRRKLASLFDGTIIAMALAFLSWVLVLGPVWRQTDLTTLGGLVAVGYPFGDVIVVFFIALVARRVRASNRLPLWCLLAGLLVMAVSDSSYSYLATTNSYTSGGLLDVGWIAAYLLIVMAAYLSPAGQAVMGGRVDSPPTLRYFLAPFVPALLALVVAAVDLQLEGGLDLVARLTMVFLIVLVLGRELFLVRDVARCGLSSDHWLTRQVRVAFGRTTER